MRSLLRPAAAITVAFLVIGVSACGADVSRPTAPEPGAVTWTDREAWLFLASIGAVIDDRGTGPPPAIYVLDRVYPEAGDIDEPVEEGAAIPRGWRESFAELLGDEIAPARFVSSPEEVASHEGDLRGALVFWLGPTRQEGDAMRTALNFTDRVEGPRDGANLVLERIDGSWRVTGASGIGSCPTI